MRRNSAESFYDSMSEEDSDVEELVEDWLGEVDLVSVFVNSIVSCLLSYMRDM